MLRNKDDEQQICQKHNLPLEFLNPDKEKPNQLYVCNQCIIEHYQLVPIQQIKQSNQRLIQQFEQQLNQNSNIWNKSIYSLIELRESFIKSTEIIENIIDVIRNQIQQTTNEFQNMNTDHMNGIKIAHESYLQIQLTHQKNIIKQMVVLQLNNSIEKLVQGLNEINLSRLTFEDSKQKITIVEIQKKQNIDQEVLQNPVELQKVKKLKYQLIPESSIKQDDNCRAISFNYDGSIIVAGCYNIVQMFEFKNKQLKKIQSIQSHENWILSLKFMKKSNQFLSGSSDTTIKLWQANNKNKWICIQTFKEHKGSIECLIINKNDDLIISGSNDQTIIFWGLNGNQWQLDQLIKCSSNVRGLSLNDSNTKLISCENNKLIQVFVRQGKKWVVFQKIQVEDYGVRLCFISDDQFVFLPLANKYLHFYKFDQQPNKFEKQLELEVSNSDEDSARFPIKFIRNKNLLIVKNCEFVNVFRKEGNSNFILVQKIEFKTPDLWGDISEDGNTMVTWDINKKEYQVRNLKEIQ